MSLVLGEMVMMFTVAGGDVVRDECGCGCGCVGAGGFVAIWICGWVCVAVSLGLGEMVMMFAAGVGVGGWCCPWVWEVGVAVGLGEWCCRRLVVWLECGKKKKNYLIIF